MIALGSNKELLESCEPYREIASLQLGDSKEDKKGKEVAYGN